jgi:hypothetical protein
LETKIIQHHFYCVFCSPKPDDPKPDETGLSEESLVASEAAHFAEQSSFAKSQLEHVAERLQNKMQALKVGTTLEYKVQPWITRYNLGLQGTTLDYKVQPWITRYNLRLQHHNVLFLGRK